MTRDSCVWVSALDTSLLRYVTWLHGLWSDELPNCTSVCEVRYFSSAQLPSGRGKMLEEVGVDIAVDSTIVVVCGGSLGIAGENLDLPS